uniref:Uncharacterized protein n=1 Tax=Anguilla anguilla TaxID=7936 RepID=A0A0E9PUH9_ANGAN
MECFQARGFE